jgi:hypothetical protein
LPADADRSARAAFIIWANESGFPAPMNVRDLARVRLANALRMFDEFVRQAARTPDAATLRGLEGRFAERLQIQPSYWSQIKSRARQIGERLARQFEQRMHKPYGWMDVEHDASGTARGSQPAPAAPPPAAEESLLPANDDERFIVGLVLTYYRRHPQRARTRLLDLLGEVLRPGVAGGAAVPAARAAADRDAELWQRTRRGVAPLKRKR